jgi:ABC-type nickel/cobalt efflux system permease component RcnA
VGTRLDGGKKIMDIEKFVKVISLTFSTSDGEALNAIKLCNEMLKKENLTWEDVIKGSYLEIESIAIIGLMGTFLIIVVLKRMRRRIF